jgi:hypothetical protein
MSLRARPRVIPSPFALHLRTALIEVKGLRVNSAEEPAFSRVILSPVATTSFPCPGFVKSPAQKNHGTNPAPWPPVSEFQSLDITSVAIANSLASSSALGICLPQMRTLKAWSPFLNHKTSEVLRPTFL